MRQGGAEVGFAGQVEVRDGADAAARSLTCAADSPVGRTAPQRGGWRRYSAPGCSARPVARILEWCRGLKVAATSSSRVDLPTPGSPAMRMTGAGNEFFRLPSTVKFRGFRAHKCRRRRKPTPDGRGFYAGCGAVRAGAPAASRRCPRFTFLRAALTTGGGPATSAQR